MSAAWGALGARPVQAGGLQDRCYCSSSPEKVLRNPESGPPTVEATPKPAVSGTRVPACRLPDLPLTAPQLWCSLLFLSA